ncbi:MAG: hypothetical protein KAW92_06455 [Candidatus Cloacimonetes bacterium]|nr:hypothetical protein [Candidatus Cloacimonadota bacterium]
MGFNYKINKFNIDFGTEYLFGAERDTEASEENIHGKHKLDVFAFSIGLGYKL